MRGIPWLERFLAGKAGLAEPVQRLRRAACTLREVAAQAFVAPAEPIHPRAAELEAALNQTGPLAEALTENPNRATVSALLQALFVLRCESFFLAPTRATSGPVARWALKEALEQFTRALEALQQACGQQGVALPWRLLAASHADESLRWAEVRLVGNQLPGVPLAHLPWGERCALTGTWWQEDGNGQRRFRSETSFFSLSPEAFRAFTSCQGAVASLAYDQPALAAEVLACFPELGHAFYPDEASVTFASLPLREFPSLAVSLHNALVRFGPRTLFFRPSDGARLSYHQVRQASLALAWALETADLPPGSLVAVACRRPGWDAYLVDFACVFSQLVSLILDPQTDRQTWHELLALAKPVAAVGDAPGLEDLGELPLPRFCLEEHPSLPMLSPSPPPENWRSRSGVGLATPLLFDDEPSWEHAQGGGIAADEAEALYTLVFTSGSSGKPKGVGISRQRMRTGFEYQAALYPLVVASFQPPSLLADRKLVWQALFNGGQVGFCRRGAELWQDVQAVAPTYLEGPPAFWQPLVAPYQQALRAGANAAELARLRLALRRRLGGRVAAVAVGGAAVPPELPGLLSACLQVAVREAYGATEVGTLAEGGRLRPGVTVRLVDHPELGFTSRDRPYPRGELAVKLPEGRNPYLVAGEEERGRVTADGFFLTGDVVELRSGGEIRVLGRVSAACKLADGQFVVAEELEAAALASGLCQQAALLSDPAGPVLLVVAPAGEPAERLRPRLRQHLARRFPGRALPPMAVDTQLTPWTPENGLLTPSFKPQRRALAQHYAELLATCASGSSAPEGQEPDQLLATVAAMLQRRPEELDLSSPLSAQGLDSLGTAELLALADARGLMLAPAELASWSLGRLLAALGGNQPTPPDTHAILEAPLPASGEEELLAELLRLPLPPTVPSFQSRGLTLVTGGTGFLGVHLLAAVAADPPAQGPVVALVRASNHVHAQRRLQEAAVRAGIGLPPVGLPGDDHARLWALACQLQEPQLGLAEDLYRVLAQQAAVLVHAAASVRHGATFRQLAADNVAPTRNLLRLATEARLKAFHLVSTLDVTRLALAVGGASKEEAPLPPRLGETAAQLDGYLASKWVAERMVELLHQHCQGQLPVLVSRPGLLAWSSQTGFANVKEWFPALLASCLQLGVLPLDQGAVPPAAPVTTESSARGLEFLPVDYGARLLAQLTSALVGSAAGGGARFFRCNLVNTNAGTDGLALWPQIFCALQAALLAELPDRPLLAAVSWRDFRDLCLSQQAPFAPLVPSFPELPAVPRMRAEIMAAFCQQSPPPPLRWPLFRPFVRWLASRPA